ncbi:nuclear transport factor 2 family protein [Plantactinospora sp. BB1]|nr:nuclear transport factor 2 family protein [Plantactinospora sp. BB1]
MALPLLTGAGADRPVGPLDVDGRPDRTAAGRLERVTRTHRELFERYVHAGAISRDPEAIAALFTDDGEYEAPLVPEGHPLPRRLVGREAIRSGIGAYHREPAYQGTVDAAASGYVLHETADPDVFLVEIDTVLVAPTGQRTTVSLVQVFRVRAGRIAKLRDYFAPPPEVPSPPQPARGA